MPVELKAPAERGVPGPQGGKPEFVLTGKHVLAMLLAFFAVIGAVNAYFISVALKTMPGTEVKSPFEESQRFNKGLAAIEEQARKGWQVDVIAGGLKAGAPISVQLRDRAGAPINGVDVVVRLQRPADARFDHRLELRAQGNGVYAAPLPDVERGQWRVAVEVKRGEQREFYSESRVIARD